jgi:large subunit ribosomal protein L15
MKINEITSPKRASKSRKGRGISAGQGKTAGRGTKGQNSRTGGSRRPGFEGGQTPIFQRIPKQRGFNSRLRNKTSLKTIDLVNIKDGKVTPQLLVDAGLAKNIRTDIKIIGTSKLNVKLNLSGVRVTEGAKNAILSAGGSVEVDNEK